MPVNALPSTLTFLCSKSFTLTHVGNVPIAVHWTLLPVIPLFVLWDASLTGAPWPLTLLEFFALFLIVLLHEAGHALAARIGGAMPLEIQLNPLYGYCKIKGAVSWKSKFFIVGAGPFVNLLLCFPLFFIGRALAPGLVQEWVIRLFFFNLSLLLFNLLPLYPLDGGQLFLALLQSRFRKSLSYFAITTGSLTGLLLLFVLCIFSLGLFLLLLPLALCIVGPNILALLWSIRTLNREATDGFHPTARCPLCNQRPRVGPTGECETCSAICNVLEGPCWNCSATFTALTCSDCGQTAPIPAWLHPSTQTPASTRSAVSPAAK
jgi:Zn-dependent protease